MRLPMPGSPGHRQSGCLETRAENQTNPRTVFILKELADTVGEFPGSIGSGPLAGDGLASGGLLQGPTSA